MTQATITLLILGAICATGGVFLLLRGAKPRYAVAPIVTGMAAVLAAIVVGLIA